jgi:hypothetical protein
MASGSTPTPIVPDYSGPCVTNIVPALLEHADIGRGWIPDEVLDAKQVVVVVIDGLGDDQLTERASLAPTLSDMRQRAITTVAPTTTATALTSIATGTSPGEHGLIGYKMWVGGEVLNALRWSSVQGDARDRIDPVDLQPITPFGGRGPAVISQAQFMTTGFTEAHLRETDYRPYWLASSIPVEIEKALGEGAPLVYAYYDGIDKVAHITGLGDHYDAELRSVDALVAEIQRRLPPGAALVVTADHGQVQVGERMVDIAPQVLSLTGQISGEARFVWLHAQGGRAQELEAAAAVHEDIAWVVPVEQVLDEGWFGTTVSSPARSRLGDVALVAHEPVALVDPANPGPMLQSRHGSMTSAETMVPLLTGVG